MSIETPNITRSFFVDPVQPGIIRGGWMDDVGGMLVGVHADWVCKVLNEAKENDDEH